MPEAKQGECGEPVHGQLVTLGAPSLRQPTERVVDFAAVQPLCAKLIETLGIIDGAGLAANQIGHAQRVLCLQTRRRNTADPEKIDADFLVMVNPDLVEVSQETVDGWESCFSVPGYTGLVPRAVKIKCRYDTPAGEEKIEVFEGWSARVIQHECDHLDGKVYLDRLRSMADLSTQANYHRYHAEK